MPVVLICLLALGSVVGFAEESTRSFRVRLGITDTEPRPWDGKLEIRGGEVLSLRSWRPRPNQEIQGSFAWKLATEQGINFKFRAWESKPASDQTPYLLVPGLIVDVKGSTATRVHFETAGGAFDVSPFALSPAKPIQVLDGAVVVDLVPAAHLISSPDSQDDFATLSAGPDGELWAAWVAFDAQKNRVRARRYDGASWTEAETVSGNHDDIFLVKTARDATGATWFVWSARVDGNFDLYGRKNSGGEWQPIERLTEAPQPDIYPAMTTDSKGRLWLVWQSFRDGNANVYARFLKDGEWSDESQISLSTANDWEPAVAADSKGRVYVAWDTYDKGNYDVVMSSFNKDEWGDPELVAGTPRFEAHVSLACDREDRLWAAWNESGPLWGKDTGFLVKRPGTQLYESRWMRVAVRDGKRWREPAAPIATSLPEQIRGYNDLPTLQADGTGRVWLLFRHRSPRIVDTPSTAPMHRAAWELFATTYAGNSWTEPIAVPFSAGRTDMRLGVAADGLGDVIAAWPTDNRDFESFLFRQADIYLAHLPSFGKRKLPDPNLRDRELEEGDVAPLHGRESGRVSRLRGYRIESGDKLYRIYRGDTHRHTEFSHDGHNDGSLIDTYRYALDVAKLDYLMVSEHNSSGGPDIEYINWLGQQMCDVLTVSGKFLPLYGYERSVGFPDGHRNVVLPRRGLPTLPIPAEESQHKTGAKALFEYLRKFGGISIPHTSATGMGTDWRDNDPEVEPLVEIYQGDRVSAEYEGAPKAATAGDPSSAPGNFRPAGYVWNAWAKGYKLGVQASSDHLSTHISYACTIAEEFTRDGLLGAMKKRHSYGATDNIILDYRLRDGDREHLQGDIVSASRRFKLWVRVLGTAPIKQIDVIRNNSFVHTVRPMKEDVEFTFADTDPADGESYYYVRVQQTDDQMAWSSPIWITIK